LSPRPVTEAIKTPVYDVSSNDTVRLAHPKVITIGAKLTPECLTAR